MNLKVILSAISGFICAIGLMIFKGYKKGKIDQKHEDTNNAVKESLEIKKDENARRDVDIDVIRDRMRKYTRDD